MTHQEHLHSLTDLCVFLAFGVQLTPVDIREIFKAGRGQIEKMSLLHNRRSWNFQCEECLMPYKKYRRCIWSPLFTIFHRRDPKTGGKSCGVMSALSNAGDGGRCRETVSWDGDWRRHWSAAPFSRHAAATCSLGHLWGIAWSLMLALLAVIT